MAIALVCWLNNVEFKILERGLSDDVLKNQTTY